MKGMNVVLIGPPGSGKGTQAELLAEKYGLFRVTVGDVLRSEIQKKTALGRKIEKIVDAGFLIDSSIAVRLVRSVLGRRKINIIFDGFPRDVYEAKKLLAMVRIDLVIVVDVPSRVVIERLGHRWVCLSGETFSDLKIPVKKMRCSDGSRPFQRDDDAPRAIRHRLQVYTKETLPVIQFFEKRTRVCHVDGAGSIRKVFLAVKKCIREYYG